MTITVPISLLFHLFFIFVLLSSNIFFKSHSNKINAPVSAIHVNIINLPNERQPAIPGTEKSENTVKVEEVRKAVKVKEPAKIKETAVKNQKSEVRSKKLEEKSKKVEEKAKVTEKTPVAEKAKVVVPEPLTPPPAPAPVRAEVKADEKGMQDKETLNPSDTNKQEALVREAKLVPGEPVVPGPVADVSDFKYDYYLNVIREKVDKRWSQPRKYTQIKQTLVEFIIHRSWEIDNIAVAETSGDYYFDQTAIRAVSLANPFPQLPRGYREETLRIRYRFIFGRQG